MGLKIAHHKKGSVNYQEVKEIISLNMFTEYLVIQDAAISNYERENKCKVELFENVFSVDVGVPGILLTKNIEHLVWWPESQDDWFHSKSLEGLVHEAFAEVWATSIEDILAKSLVSSDEKSYEAAIGKFNDVVVEIDHVDIIRRSKPK